MATSGTFRAGIAVRQSDAGQIITERVACRYETQVLRKREDIGASARKIQYRLNMLNTLRAACWQLASTEQGDTDTMVVDVDLADELLVKFVSLAATLEHSKAVAICFGEEESETDTTLTQSWNDVLADIDGNICTSLAHRMEFFDCPSVRKGLLHPLAVALLAYHLGGPINAANTAYAHTWTPPEAPMTLQQSLHTEGDCGDFFEEHRITLVWETQDESEKGVSGQHHTFLSGDATPRLLETLNVTEGRAGSPVTIIYDSGSAALGYDCPDAGAVRNSVTLEFHLNTVADNDIQLLAMQPEEIGLEEVTLTKLLTSFPVVNYTTIFNRLLFDAASLEAIVAKLSALDMATPQPAEDTSKAVLAERFERHKRDNWDNIPPEIMDMQTDITIAGTYNSPASFLNSLCVKARRDIHLPIGMNLFPQTRLDENRESARKLIRDLPGEFVEARLAHYAPILVVQYTSQNLVSTPFLRKLGMMIEHRCLELMANGFVDDACHLPSIAALASAFGRALDGPKESRVATEPRVNESYLQVYRTRCLYLFWCADWLFNYLRKPEEGPFMARVVGETTEALKWVRAEVEQAARLLLRNWIAWGLFMEAMPPEGFPFSGLSA